MPRQTIVRAGLFSRFARTLRKYVAFTSFLLIFSDTYAEKLWQTLAPGIEYRDLNATLLTPWSHVHVFRVDLKKNKLDLVTANELARAQASVDQFAHASQALIAINGGFFDKTYHPLGLRIGHQHQYSGLKPISWWGIFYTLHNKPYVTNFAHYPASNAIDFAVQSGPRLLIDGKIPSLKPGHAERTALGVTKRGYLMIVVTDHAPMTTTALAHLMRSKPLSCQNALNLDGGSSSQLHAHMGDFQLNVHGFSDVSDAIIIKPR